MVAWFLSTNTAQQMRLMMSVGNKRLTPIDTRTDTEKAIDDLADGISANCSDDQSFKEDAINMLNFIKAGKIHGVTFTGDK